MGTEILETGAVGAAMVVVYVLVTKVIYPLVKGTGNGNGNGNGKQQFVNQQLEHRINRNEKEIREIKTSLAEIRRTVDLSQAILERVEASLKYWIKKRTRRLAQSLVSLSIRTTSGLTRTGTNRLSGSRLRSSELAGASSLTRTTWYELGMGQSSRPRLWVSR